MNLEDLQNRLHKNARHAGRWARREGVEAYRLYDRDIPEFPYVVDRYGDWLYVQEYETRRPVPPDQSAARLAAIAAGVGTTPEKLVLVRRRRQRGAAQYEKSSDAGQMLVVTERGLRFEVNLGRYLDTGLFLDHRDTRAWVRERAAGKTFLNLFAYTGSFTVYAAAGNALRTVSVDMSATYQRWTRRNLLHNRLDDFRRHRLVCEDVLTFLEHAAVARSRFDLIVLDPPSFSNSKRMRGTFDVQRDHPALLELTIRLLAPGGELVFSTNRQGFRLADHVAAFASVEEITNRTVPPDFRRRRPHRCWLLRTNPSRAGARIGTARKSA